MPNSFIEEYRRSLAEQGLTDDTDDYTLTREFLGPIAQKNPALFDQYPDFAKEFRAIREANAPSLSAEVGRGLKRGGLGLLSTAAGGASLFTGDGWLRRKSHELDQAAGSPDLAPTVSTIEDIAPGEQDTWNKVLSRDALRYLAAKTGEAAPSIAEAVGTSIAGAAIGTAAAPGPGTIVGAGEGLVARSVIKAAIRQLVKKGLEEEAIVAGLQSSTPEIVNAVAQTAKSIAAVRGGTAVTALNSYLLNSGDVLNEVPDNPGLAAGLGVVSAIPDTILPTIILKKLFPGVGVRVAQQEAKELVANKAVQLAKKIGMGAGSIAGEGATEYFQEAINVVARNIRDGQDPLHFDDADLRRFREAGITGAVGGLLAAPAVALEGRPEQVSAEPTAAAEIGPIATNITGQGIPQPQAQQASVSTARSNAQLVAAVHSMDDATAVARRDELSAMLTRSPELETEFQLLLARAPLASPSAAAGPSAIPASGIAAVTGPAAAPAAEVTENAAKPSPAPEPRPESNYLYTISRPQMAGDPGYIQVDEVANGQSLGSHTVEELNDRGVKIPQPPAWLPTGQYTLTQITDAITKGEPNAIQIQVPAAVHVQPTSETGGEVRGGNAIVQEPAAARQEEAASVEKPFAPLAPRDAAPEVAAQTDLPKPSELPATVPSVAPTPVERAAVVATETKPQGLPYGPIIEGGPTIDFRDFESIKASDWERAIRANLRHPQAARGDKGGARATTRVAMALQEPGGDGVVLAGVVVPQRLQRVSGGTEIDGIALQRFGSGTKTRVVEVGGDQPVLLREAIAAGYKPMAIVHFAGEPAKIFHRFGNLSEFDQAYSATDKSSGRSGAGVVETPKALPEVRRAIRGEQEIQAEIDRLGGEYQRADKPTQERLSLEIVKLFDELNETTRKGQSQTGDVALQTGSDVSQAPITANRTQQFIAVMNRLRQQGGQVDVFTREFFSLGVKSTVESQIMALRARQQQATTNAQRRAIERAIFLRQQRLSELNQARGAAFGPWHIALAVDDVQNATTGNLVTLLHEAAESLAMQLNPAMKGRISRAITASLADVREKTATAAASTGVAPANEVNAFDALSESLAQRLASEGVPEAPSLAQTILRWVKDLYYRTTMALQRAFGAEPSDEMSLDWFENQLRRVVGGDYDYRIARLLDRYLPEPTVERVARFNGPTGTPGGMTDYWNPYGGGIQQPSVLPSTIEALGWNVEFQSLPTQRAGGEEIPGPEARGRIEAAALNDLVDRMEAIRTTSGTELPWAEWWGAVGTGDDPKVMLATLAQRAAGVETARIGGARMTQAMNDLAGLEVRRLLENVQSKAYARIAQSNEQIETESDRVIDAAKEVNRLEGDRRNAELQEATLQDRLKTLVRRFVRDNSNGFRAAEQQGQLAEAVRSAEGLLAGDTIPRRYQQVFKSILDGQVPVLDYVRAVAELDLPISDMTQREVAKAIRDNADSSETLKRLADNRPLLAAISVLAKQNAGQVDEIHLGWLRDAEKYRAIHEELHGIRQATDEQLKQMIAGMEERSDAATLRDRLKRDYLKRRRDLQTARNRVAVAQRRVDSITSALPAISEAVDSAQQTGSQAPSEWTPVDGANFIEMTLGEDGAWHRSSRVLRFRDDGSAVDGDAVQKAVWGNNLWLKSNAAKAGSATYERVLRQTTQLGMLDLQAKYAAAHGFKVDTFLAPLVAEARQLGGAGARVAQMLQFFEHTRFVNRQQVDANSRVWSKAWNRLKKITGISDDGLILERFYDPLNYFLNTEPGMDEEAALRNAVRMARARLTGPASEGFGLAIEQLLRASKSGFEYLLSVANQSGAFVKDPRLNSELRRAVSQGWLTSMRSVDAGLVTRITRDMEKSGWKLARRKVDGAEGQTREEIVRAVTFEDLGAEEASNSDALGAMLQQLFTPGIVRDWLVPFINKGGVEVFRHGDEPIPQLVLQNAWAAAKGNVLSWVDAVGQEVGLGVPEEAKGGGMTDPVGDFRLSMLHQIDSLFGMEAKLAFETSQTRNMFDPMGPKPHVMMDARLNDTIPPEHLNFAKLDPHTSQMLLAEIAFHGAFGRNGERMIQTLSELRQHADAAKVDYEALQGTNKNTRVAEAVARGWKDYGELERAAERSNEVRRFQSKLEAFMSVGHPGGPFDGMRAGMTVLNFMAGQIVDNPKTAFYNLLSLAQTPFAQRSLGPASLRSVTDAFVTTAKTGLGSILEAMHLHLMHASAEEAEIAQALGASRNLPWDVAVADAGPGGPQKLSDRVLVRPLNFLRYVQNKGVGLPFQGKAGEFPRLAVIPGLGVSNSIAQIAAVGGMSAQLRMLKRMVSRGIEYYAAHRDAAQDPNFRFKARDLGMGRADQGVFDWWRVKSVEYGLGTIEDMVRASMPAAAKGERLLTRDQVLKVAQMVATEINGDSSINTTPSLLVTNPFLRTVFPLLRWPFWAMHKTHEGLRTVEGRRNYASVAKGLGILAMWNLPVGLALTFLLDRYDEDLLGKKSNLPAVGGLAALPFAGPVAEAIMSDKSIPDTLKAYLVRSARAGNIYGLGSDLIGQIASPTDAASGRRTFSLDQRILAMSQLLNMQQALSNAAGQDWTTTWASVWHPLFRSLGGNGALHVLDVANNLLGLDNGESRMVTRVNASNWLRAAASELDIELRPGGSGTPTPMSVWTREMLTAAMANDRIGFLDSYRKALDAARKVVSTDPMVKPPDREREAESRVLAGWRGRDPLTIFAHRPTEIEVRRMLGIMDSSGATEVKEALNRFNQFTRLISVGPAQQQARALDRRLTRSPALANPFRRTTAAPVY